MANYCDYEIHVRGKKKAALMMFAVMPVYDSKYIVHEDETDIFVAGEESEDSPHLFKFDF